MALKMKETFEKTASAAAKQLGSYPANVYINRAGRSVPVSVPQITPSNQNTPKEDLPEKIPSEDSESIRGKQPGNIF